MESLCEKMQQAEDGGQDSNVFFSPLTLDEKKLRDKMDEAGTSGQNVSLSAGELSEDMATSSDPGGVSENRRKLLSEIRSCFRILSIHSRLSGTESPRTMRVISQANSSQSLHSLAMEKSIEINCPGSSNGVLGADAVQSCLLYNQLITGTPILTPGGAGLQPLGCQENLGSEITNESRCEDIHQVSMVNPTLQLKPKEELSKSDVMKVVEWLYRDHPGAVWRAASREAMAEQENRDSLIYGEVSFVAFAKLMENYCPIRYSDTSASASNSCGENVAFNFYDMGCGGGRCVFMASLLNTNCAKACGIEIVPGMHQMNQILLRLYHMEVLPNLHPLKQAQKLEFFVGDFLQMDWSDADVIFTNATCFQDQLFLQFENIAGKVLKPGAIVISVARVFTRLELWDLLEQQERRMSWAPVMIYVYKRKGPGPCI